MKTAAIYARVSSDKQKEENTIASQTAALIAFAAEQGYAVPAEWVFEDEGYSGASLIRPGLERVRDLVAEGQLDAVLVYAPDRLSRRYAYQILLIEEFARAGVETLFIRSPRTATAEDQLLLQFQGMIAEYERAQILERSRRGKRHRARQGQVSVLSGAPFGYRYIRKSEQSAAYYEIDEVEAPVVRSVYERYTVDGLSIGAITRLLNDRQIPTRKQTGRWERSTVWAMLRNPAYKGAAGFGKTQTAPRQRITRPLRLRGGIASRDSAHHERPQDEWIAIAVPSIIMSRPSPSPRSACKPTRRTHRAVPSCPALCRAWCPAPTAVTRSTEHRRGRARAQSITIAVWAPTRGAGSADRFAPAARSARICSMRSHGPKSSSCSRIPALSKANSTVDWRRHATPTRQNGEKQRFGVISPASKTAPGACSPPTKKTFCHSMSCATACPICVSARTQSAPSCNQSQIRPPTALPICVSPKP
jgi:DNA invertase Pin-like site-specific DNA recombinase